MAKAYRVGTVILPHFRNCGWSAGLEHPFIYQAFGKYAIVWNRHTGVVCYVTKIRADERWEGFAFGRAEKRAEQLNAWRAGYKSGRLPVDIGAIDSTP